MSRLSFNKATLHKQVAQLKRYQQYLPSLELKRQQLIAERNKARIELTTTEQLIAQCYSTVETQLPMLADEHIDLHDLVSIKQLYITKQNLVGISLPIIDKIEIESKSYSFITLPHWVDRVIVELKTMLHLKIQLNIQQQRLGILDQAVKKVTQRVNLFDKVLIPKTQTNIAKIIIFLSDAERAAVVRAKITKQKRLKDNSCGYR